MGDTAYELADAEVNVGAGLDYLNYSVWELIFHNDVIVSTMSILIARYTKLHVGLLYHCRQRCLTVADGTTLSRMKDL